MAKKNIKKNTEDLKEMNVSDLKQKLVSLKEEVRVIRFKNEGSKVKNVKEVATLKKNIARVMTEINSKVTK
jgi:ribosomal protein L29